MLDEESIPQTISISYAIDEDGLSKANATASGRGIPCVSAQAVGFQITVNEVIHGTGTSGATPVVAGIISLLNDWQIWRGEPESPFGFLIPWLYGSSYIALNDITVGSIPGCNNDGFSATAGWDPAALQVWPI
ncbi:hypothetical protein EDB85DRAFT_2286090 [Lactarius pseudohatsudake]|nr:hypothetical protein EDB85DRAFT_2286090 [Lactarius pseudohatsudake]